MLDRLLHVVDVGMDHVLTIFELHGLEGDERLASKTRSLKREGHVHRAAGLFSGEGGRGRDLVSLVVECGLARGLVRRGCPQRRTRFLETRPVYSIVSTIVSSSRAWPSWVPHSLASVAVVFMVLGMFSITNSWVAAMEPLSSHGEPRARSFTLKSRTIALPSSSRSAKM